MPADLLRDPSPVELPSLAALMRASAASFGDAPCLLPYGDDARERSFSDVLDFSRGFAAYLDEFGVPIGARVAVCFHNSQLAALLFLGTLAAGRVLVPINPRSGPLECQHILNLAKPRLLLVEGGYSARFADGASLVAPIEVGDQGALIESVIERRSAGGLAEPRGSDDAEIVFTSGSSGLPKGVVLSHSALFSNSRAIARLLALDSEDRLLTVCPLYHNSGQVPTTLAALWSGSANLVARSDFAMLKLWQLVAAARPTWTLVMNAFLNLTLQRDEAPATCSLKGILAGGSRLSPEVIRAFEERFAIPVLQCYGLTETTSIATCQRPDAAGRSGGAGQAVESCEVRVDAPDSGGVGEILIRGSNLFTGYLDQPELTLQKQRGGWLATGDLGRIDGSGMLHIVDRVDSMVIVGGENVYPAEIEMLTPELEGVEETVVVGVAHPILGAELILVYRARPGIEVHPERWNEVFVKHLSQFKIPRRRLPLEAIGLDDFPRADNGKILRREVREKVLATLSGGSWQ